MRVHQNIGKCTERSGNDNCYIREEYNMRYIIVAAAFECIMENMCYCNIYNFAASVFTLMCVRESANWVLCRSFFGF